MRGNQSSNFRRHPHILIIDAHNSDRSQMAEGFMRKEAHDLIEAHSVGISSKPLDRRTIEVMKEIGIDIRNQQEKLVSRKSLLWADVIIVIAGPDESLNPAVPSSATEKRWVIASPEINEDGDSLNGYRKTRDQVHQRVRGLIQSMRLFSGKKTLRD